VPVEVVTLRVTAIGTLPKPALERRELGPTNAETAVIARAPVIFAEGTLETLVYERSGLEPGAYLTGPALIVQADCTTVIHPGQTANVDAFGNLIVTTGVTTDATMEMDARVHA
jgi:N-methylhydantoinase A